MFLSIVSHNQSAILFVLSTDSSLLCWREIILLLNSSSPTVNLQWLLQGWFLNDTHMEEPVLYWIQYKNWLKYRVGCFWRFSYVYAINWVLLIPLSYRCLKNVIHHIDSKNEWLLLSVAFTEKLELVFVLTFENAFS